jgi:hypothetical protein
LAFQNRSRSQAARRTAHHMIDMCIPPSGAAAGMKLV